jgi:hypothetical protein
MSVKGILSKDEFEKLEAGEQENFVNRDGSDLYYLDLIKEEADEIAGLQPLKNVTKKERKRADQAEKQLKQFSNLGKNPEELLAMIELAAKADDTSTLPPHQNHTQQADINTVLEKQHQEHLRQIAKMGDGHKSALAAKDTEVDTLKKKIAQDKFNSAISEAGLAVGIKPKNIKWAQQDLAGRVQFNDTGKATMLDEDGDPTSINVQDFLDKDWRKENDDMYVKVASGGGVNLNSNAPSGGFATKYINAGDHKAFNDNLDAIRSGKVKVKT